VDSLDAADRVLTEIQDAIRVLPSFPQMGHRRSELTSRPLRFHSVRDFVITYAPDEKPLVVLAVLHGRRNPRIVACFHKCAKNSGHYPRGQASRGDAPSPARVAQSTKILNLQGSTLSGGTHTQSPSRKS
jgi:plasmid stabilization system protein ParE